jgi:hypothetical protein
MSFFSGLFGGGESKDPQEIEVDLEGVEKTSFYGSENENKFIDEISEDSESLVSKINGENDGFKDVYGNTLSETAVSENPFINFTEKGKKANILGLPLNFCKTADPNGRVYKNTIMQDLPYVFIVPGKPRLNPKLVDSNDKKIKRGNLAEQLDSLSDPNKFAVKGARTENDLRFMGFKADYYDYHKYVQTMLSTLHSSMGLGGIFNYENEFKPGVSNYGLCFYADKSTSISESASNDYSESSLVQKANDISAANREFKTILGFNSKIKDMESKSLDDMVDSLTSSNGILSRAFGAVGRILNGSQLLYPDIWTDSKFDRTYTINFKFFSPYGDKESIFKNVYVPFISLLALALPRQDSLLGYAQPFVMKMVCPGWFESSMCVVQSISFVKGGNDNLWTIDNLPQEIEVNLTIKDLYSTLASTKKFSVLAYNLGLASFLDNMAGIRTDQLNLVLRGKNFIKTRLSAPSKIFNGGIFSDFAYQIQTKVNDILK